MGQILLQQLLLRHVEQWTVIAQVVGYVQDVLAPVHRRVDEVGLLNQSHERNRPVGDVQPVGVRERLLEHEDDQHGGQVLHALQLVEVVLWQALHEAREYVGGRGGENGVEVEHLRALAARLHLQAIGAAVADANRAHGRRDVHLAAKLPYARVQRLEDLGEAAEGVSQPLFLHPLHSLAARGKPGLNLAPEPGHCHLVVVCAELAAQQRPPHYVVDAPAGAPADPVGGHEWFQLAPVLVPAKVQRHKAEPKPVDEAQGLELQQVHRRHEVVDAAAVEETHLGLDPRQLRPQAKLVDEVNDVGVASEEVVVSALQPAASHVKSGRLSAEEGRALVDHGLMARLAQSVRRRHSRGSRADDPYSHG